MKALLWMLLGAVLWAGCNPAPDGHSPMLDTVERVQSPRIVVERIGTFRDSLAHNGRRDVFMIHDTETGARYFGVTGVGVAEVFEFRQGKRTESRDE